MTVYTPYPKEMVRLTDRQYEARNMIGWTKEQLLVWLQRVHDGPLLHPGNHPFKKKD